MAHPLARARALLVSASSFCRDWQDPDWACNCVKHQCHFLQHLCVLPNLQVDWWRGENGGSAEWGDSATPAACLWWWDPCAAKAWQSLSRVAHHARISQPGPRRVCLFACSFLALVCVLGER